MKSRVAVLLLGTAAAVAAPAPDDDGVEAGRAIATDRNRGNCFSCHRAAGAEMPGNSGPALVNMRQRYPQRDVLRAQIADPRTRNPQTVMPPYGAHGILTGRELELLVDYLLTL